MADCNTCKANKVCDHNKYGFENCNNYIPPDVVKECKNISDLHPVDEFHCSKCGLILEDYTKKVIDEDDGDVYHFEYEIKFCPECGLKVGENNA